MAKQLYYSELHSKTSKSIYLSYILAVYVVHNVIKYVHLLTVIIPGA